MTVGDVAARAGVTINEAEEALNALAADCAGSLEVSLSQSAHHADCSMLCAMKSVMSSYLTCYMLYTIFSSQHCYPAVHITQTSAHSIATRLSMCTQSSAQMIADQAVSARRFIASANNVLLLLQVSGSGDILYALPSNFKQVIAGKSWLLRAEPFLQKLRDASAYLVRVSFGTALITSVVLVWVTILAILSSGSRDDDNRRLAGLCFY